MTRDRPDLPRPINPLPAVAAMAAEAHAVIFGCDDEVCRDPSDVSCIELVEAAAREEATDAG